MMLLFFHIATAKLSYIFCKDKAEADDGGGDANTDELADPFSNDWSNMHVQCVCLMHMLTTSVLSVVGAILYQLVPVDRDRHQKCSLLDILTYIHT